MSHLFSSICGKSRGGDGEVGRGGGGGGGGGGVAVSKSTPQSIPLKWFCILSIVVFSAMGTQMQIRSQPVTRETNHSSPSTKSSQLSQAEAPTSEARYFHLIANP